MAFNDPIPLPDINYLRTILSYEPQSGLLVWSRDKNPQWNGMTAGSLNEKGYRRIKINRRLYLAHRIAYLMGTGADPGLFEVDHKDGNPSNNALDNLRLASHGANQANGAGYRGCSSKHRGVSYCNRNRKWIAAINKDKKKHWLGYFGCENKAASAYNDAAKKLFGEFARLNILEQ